MSIGESSSAQVGHMGRDGSISSLALEGDGVSLMDARDFFIAWGSSDDFEMSADGLQKVSQQDQHQHQHQQQQAPQSTDGGDLKDDLFMPLYRGPSITDEVDVDGAPRVHALPSAPTLTHRRSVASMWAHLRPSYVELSPAEAQVEATAVPTAPLATVPDDESIEMDMDLDLDVLSTADAGWGWEELSRELNEEESDTSKGLTEGAEDQHQHQHEPLLDLDDDDALLQGFGSLDIIPGPASPVPSATPIHVPAAAPRRRRQAPVAPPQRLGQAAASSKRKHLRACHRIAVEVTLTATGGVDLLADVREGVARDLLQRGDMAFSAYFHLQSVEEERKLERWAMACDDVSFREWVPVYVRREVRSGTQHWTQHMEEDEEGQQVLVLSFPDSRAPVTAIANAPGQGPAHGHRGATAQHNAANAAALGGRCRQSGCQQLARRGTGVDNGYCSKHGGGMRCVVGGCSRGMQNNDSGMPLCATHCSALGIGYPGRKRPRQWQSKAGSEGACAFEDSTSGTSSSSCSSDEDEAEEGRAARTRRRSSGGA